MKLLNIQIESSASCGGLLNGLAVNFRESFEHQEARFDPICLIGPNGAGKSQFLQTLAEIFQAAWHACSPAEERQAPNIGLSFAIEYLIWSELSATPTKIRISRNETSQSNILVESETTEGWTKHDCAAPGTQKLLPVKIIGYTSGENETLSLPFFTSRAGYADEVTSRALPRHAIGRTAIRDDASQPLEPRLMLIDYGTHLEVLVSNLLLGTKQQQDALLSVANLSCLRSVRCVIQLASGLKASSSVRKKTGRKGVQLTEELESYIANLKACCTCWDYETTREIYTFDFWCDSETSTAFRSFFGTAFELYRALHKLALLNDLAISRTARRRFEKDVSSQRFAARLPEPPDEDKVFRFEQVTFTALDTQKSVDYVSLSDGEHQLVEILGVFAMIEEQNVLFLLDEPESHFNPQWRVAFMSKLRGIPTSLGNRGCDSPGRAQDVLLTTHAPFVPSDMKRENVMIFERVANSVSAHAADIQTYGASFEEILEHCFKVEPPISGLAREEIAGMMSSNDKIKIAASIGRLGASVEKVLLVDHLRTLEKIG